jgi:anti-sigma B factor antagonist
MMAALEQCTHRSILEVEGTLRAPVNAELSQRVQALLACGERRILLDLSRLSDMDAAGVGELVRAFNTTSAAGGILQIVDASRRVRQLLNIAGVLKLLTAERGGVNWK